MIKLIEDIINRRKLNKFQKAMLIYLCILFTLLGVYYYFQAKKSNERVEYVYNTSLNDSICKMEGVKAQIELTLKNKSKLIIFPYNAEENRTAFKVFDKGYNKISKKGKSTKLFLSNGVDSIAIFLTNPKDF